MLVAFVRVWNIPLYQVDLALDTIPWPRLVLLSRALSEEHEQDAPSRHNRNSTLRLLFSGRALSDDELRMKGLMR